MTNSVLRKIRYDNKPNFKIPESYREFLRKCSQYACVYCTISESECCGATFNIDHFRPYKLFPQYYAECDNLRYVCPRCNSYKSAVWIAEDIGCIRNCEVCKNKVCDENVERFIDVLKEEPEKMLFMNEKGLLEPRDDSIPASFTIKYLRLNREQLIKLRNVRRFIELWREELCCQLEILSSQKENFNKKQTQYEVIKRNIANDEKQRCLLEIVEIMFELLYAELEKEELIIKDEIKNLDKLIELRTGSDDTF